MTPVLPLDPVLPELPAPELPDLLADGAPPPVLELLLQFTPGAAVLAGVVVEVVHEPGARTGGAPVSGWPGFGAAPNGIFMPIWLTGTRFSDDVPEAFVTCAEVASAVDPGHQATNQPSATVLTTF